MLSCNRIVLFDGSVQVVVAAINLRQTAEFIISSHPPKVGVVVPKPGMLPGRISLARFLAERGI